MYVYITYTYQTLIYIYIHIYIYMYCMWCIPINWWPKKDRKVKCDDIYKRSLYLFVWVTICIIMYAELATKHGFSSSQNAPENFGSSAPKRRSPRSSSDSKVCTGIGGPEDASSVETRSGVSRILQVPCFGKKLPYGCPSLKMVAKQSQNCENEDFLHQFLGGDSLLPSLSGFTIPALNVKDLLTTPVSPEPDQSS